VLNNIPDTAQWDAESLAWVRAPLKMIFKEDDLQCPDDLSNLETMPTPEELQSRIYFLEQEQQRLERRIECLEQKKL
jgi:hypothetical protein